MRADLSRKAIETTPNRFELCRKVARAARFLREQDNTQSQPATINEAFRLVIAKQS